MTTEERELRLRFRSEYGKAADRFYERVVSEGFTDAELAAVPALFLPGCGNLYAQSLVKVAIIGEGTNGWKDSLLVDLHERRGGRYNPEFSFDVLQNEKDGPTAWRNPFWKAMAEILNTVYATHSALDSANPIFRGIAWGNSYPIEVYKHNGQGGKIDNKSISQAQHAKIQRIADECGLSSLERFVRVFRPNVIIYALQNSSGSNRIFPKDLEHINTKRPVDGKLWTIKTYWLKKVLMVQTHHPSFATGWQHIPVDEFGRAIAEELMRHDLFAPPAKEHFYRDINDGACKVFSKLLNDEAVKLQAEGMCEDKKILSYRLALALADHLRITNSTMTASLMVRLLNNVNVFKASNWQYSAKGRGPCAVAAGAWRYYKNDRKEDKNAAKIEEAFTRLNGRYAYEQNQKEEAI